MSNLQDLSDAQVVLLAAQFISDVNVESLQVLAAEREDVLSRDLIYRLLLTLFPSNDTARSALLALLRTVRADFANVSHLDGQVDTSAVAKLSPDGAANLAKQLFLDNVDHGSREDEGNPLARFVINWAHHVEQADGALEDVVPLIEECIPESPVLEQWASTYFLPLVRLRYQFYVGEADFISLQLLETLSGASGVKVLLTCAQKHSAQAQIARDLDEIITPWIEGTSHAKHLPKASWADVFQWVLDTSLTDFPLAAKALLEWDGPHSVRAGSSTLKPEDLVAFAQTAFAVVYGGGPAFEGFMPYSHAILQRFAAMVGASVPDIALPDPDIPGTAALIKEVSDANLLQNYLSSKDNKLTIPAQSSVAFLAAVLKTTDVLLQYKITLPVAEITRICLSASEERQYQILQRLLQHVQMTTNTEPKWSRIRQQLLWLRSWTSEPETKEHEPRPGALLGNLAKQHIEQKLLETMLGMGHYLAARQTFLEGRTPPVEASVVETQVVDAIHSAFDNASNGNRNRGGVKRASDMLATFRKSFPHSHNFQDIEHLLKATHSLSFYQLTLQHGVPFRPVNIRAHKDPLELVARVLEQDSKAYTKLDDLLEIGRNLVLAHLHEEDSQNDRPDEDSVLFSQAEQRVTYLAITAALASHDFDTAYSYITTRLSSTSTASGKASEDNYSWRAAYAAGRYRPSQPPKSLHNRISSLSQRMDLLSLSLTLAPHSDSLSEILGQWRRCEEEMDTLRSQALEEERAFDDGGEDTMPGGFGLQDQERDAVETRQALAKRSYTGSAATYEEEAPMGLFDVARGAATALRKSAFPLNAASMKDLKIRDGHARQGSDGSAPMSPVTEDASGRARKRDMVSNMVTSGLVSGMGWVLGAQPTENKDSEQD